MDRLFLGVPISPKTADELAALVDPRADGVRWTPKENYHLTLHFIGEAHVGVVDRAVNPVGGRAFEVRFSEAGAFHSRGGAALWIGVEPCEPLLALHDALQRALIAAGVEVESRRYTPHLTIGRTKSPHGNAAVAEFLARAKGRTFTPSLAREFVLYRSTLRPTGSVYEALRRYPLSDL
jgi:2'-5' RNA ligase